MGLKQNDGGNYITIYNGKFTQRVPDDTEGAVSRVNKLGKLVYEKHYDSFVGKLVSIKTQDGDYGKMWLFTFKDGKDVYHLQLSYSNSYATAFLKMLPNIDLTKEMKVSPQVKEVDGKKKSSLFVNQNGVSIKHAYTRENPNGLPQMEQVMVKGQKVWDDSKILVFLEEMVKEKIVPQLEGVSSFEDTKADGKDSLDTLVDEMIAVDGEDDPF